MSEGKVRINVSLSPGTLRKAKAIAKADKRPSVSNTVENLIEREAERLGVQGEERQDQEAKAA